MKKPVYKTAPYLQRVMTRYPIDSDIKSIAVADDNLLYAASEKGLHKLENGKWLGCKLKGDTKYFTEAYKRACKIAYKYSQ